MSRLTSQKIEARKRLKTTVNQMIPAVLTALVATALGFIALYTSPVPMIQDFGKMLTIGMTISFIVGIFILIPLLFIRDGYFVRNNDSQKSQKNRSISKMDVILRRWTNIVGKLKWVILIVSIVAASVGVYLDLDAKAETDVESFMPQESQALMNIETVRNVLGTTEQVSIVYESENVLAEETMQWVDDLGGDLEEEFFNEIVTVQSLPAVLESTGEMDGKEKFGRDVLDSLPTDQRDRLVNPSMTKGVLHIGIEKLPTEDLEIFIEDLGIFIEEERIGGVETTITGQSVVDLEMVSALTSGRYQMTLLGMAFVFLGLFAFYRSPIKALLPLFPIVLIVGWSGLAVSLLGIEYTPLTATLGALIIGIGTEFTILLMERYYEERKNGELNLRAILIANQKVGKAILASALTTLGGFSALLISDFEILSNFGMMTLINIALAVVSTLVVMPALLMIVGRWINVKSVS
ncbi:efflux RND transporter permease subunit [Salipaludibacillus daqingensis]|uniref:efflux RND transporter permease subunit n=1 Tax=Salipaludibacillus daqingensis TaxID=3041001 RepID=UPI00247430D4|nr:MMPL family transporter [Salipaludibacillus daqingensis]